MYCLLISALIFVLNLSAVHSQLKIPITRKPSPYIPKNIAKAYKLDGSGPVIMNANNAIGKDSDGYSQFNASLSNFQNLQYYGEVVAGTQNQTFTILFDTGSEPIWLPSKGCDSCSSSGNRLDCDTSSTCFQTGNPDSFEYGTGAIEGSYIWENVGFSADGKINCSVLLVTDGESLTDVSFDGIMGLGSQASPNNFVDIAYKEGIIKDTIFSFYLDLNPSYSGNYINYDFIIHGHSNNQVENDNSTISNSSYLLLGYIPEDKVNNLFWVPVTLDDYWATDVIGLSIGGEPIDMTEDFRSRVALFDSGTSILVLTPNVHDKLLEDLYTANCMRQGNEVPTCLCRGDDDYNKYPNITFSTRGMSFNVTSHQYLVNAAPQGEDGVLWCAVGVQNLDDMEGIGMMILGDSFFRSNYVAFSKRNQTMGFEMTDKLILRPVDHNVSNLWTGGIGVALISIGLLIVNILEEKEHRKELKESYSDPDSPMKKSTSPFLGKTSLIKRSHTDKY